MDLRSIATSNVPVICVDTCSLLDVMRDPTRETINVAHNKAALVLIELAAQNKIICIMAEQVDFEFNDLIQDIETEATVKLKKFRKQAEHINKLSEVYGSPGRIDLSHLDNHVSNSRSKLDRWHTGLHKISPSSDVYVKASARVNAGRAPSKRGKESSKDCLIYETYLYACAELRNAGLTTPIVFLSSNTTEYLIGGKLNPHIHAELEKLSVDYAQNAGLALYQIGMSHLVR